MHNAICQAVADFLGGLSTTPSFTAARIDTPFFDRDGTPAVEVWVFPGNRTITQATRTSVEKDFEVYVELVKKQVPHSDATARLAEVDSLVLLMEEIETALMQNPEMSGATLNPQEAIEVPVFVPEELVAGHTFKSQIVLRYKR